jgi:hypothetical protein
MKDRSLTKTAGALLLQLGLASAATGQAPAPGQEITRAGTQPSSAGPAEFFTGNVRVQPVWPANEHIRVSRRVPARHGTPTPPASACTSSRARG